MTDGKKMILFVDDDPLIRDLYCRKLQSAGYSVRQAEDGALGLADATSFHPDLIVLDMIMPKMDGYQTLENLRAHDEWGAHVPVIVFTNDKLDKDSKLESIEKTTPSYFLTKATMTPEALVEKIAGILA